MARKRSQTVETRETASSSIVARADRLRRLVRERAHREEQAVLTQGLSTRRDELRETVLLAAQLVGASALLAEAGIAVGVDPDPLAALRTRLSGLRRDFASDPQSLARPHAFDRSEYARALTTVRDALLIAWRQHVAPPDGDGLAGVLERYAPFRPVAGRLREIQHSLTTLARTLPRDAADIERVRTLKDRAAGVLRGLHIDAVLLDFLTRAQTGGYPLEEALGNTHLLEQLRVPGLLTCLRVVAG